MIYEFDAEICLYAFGKYYDPPVSEYALPQNLFEIYKELEKNADAIDFNTELKARIGK